MESVTGMKALFIVVNAGFTDEIMDIARIAGAGGTTILNARGEGARHESFMGISLDSEREIILILVDENTAKEIMTAVKETAGMKTPIRGVCFILPVEKMIGINKHIPFDQTQE